MIKEFRDFIAKGNVDEMPDFAAKDPNNLLLLKADGTFHEAGLAMIKAQGGIFGWVSQSAQAVSALGGAA